MKTASIKKGMVLCAGLGTRLLPITEKYPKPLVPVLNIPNLLHSVHLLERVGVRDLIINLFHLPDQIEAFFKSPQYSRLHMHYSRESVLLGTGGGVKKAEPFFEGKPFLLANCDFVTDINLTPILNRHFSANAIATMVLFQDEKRQDRYSKVGVDSEGYLCSLPKTQVRPPVKTGIFTGIHVLNPEIFSFLEEKPSGINEVLYPALMKQFPSRVLGEFGPFSSYWYDTGDIPALWQATMQLLSHLSDPKSSCREILQAFTPRYVEVRPHVWMPEGETLPRCAIHSPVMIGSGCEIAESATIGPYAVIGDHVVVEAGARVTESVVLSPARIAKQVTCSGRIAYQEQRFPQNPLSN